MNDYVVFALIMGGLYLGVGLYVRAVHRMNNAIAVSIPALVMGAILMGIGLYARYIPLIIMSLLPLSMGFWFLYKGIPLELRERRYRAMRRRWEKLDEELKERDKKKQDGAR